MNNRQIIQCSYQEYKGWEQILGKNAEESTVSLTPALYAKILGFRVGPTHYYICGPFVAMRGD